MKYKVGDRVICKSGFTQPPTGHESTTWGGYGYVEGFEFTITRMTGRGDGPLRVLWPDEDDGDFNGVFQQAVRLYNPIKPYKNIKKHEMI